MLIYKKIKKLKNKTNKIKKMILKKLNFIVIHQNILIYHVVL